MDFVVKADLSKFKYHDQLKESLLTEINSTNTVHDLTEPERDPGDRSSISRLDWYDADDDTRPWTNILYDKLIEHFNQVAKDLGFYECVVKQLWFQQYTQNDTHRWHIHGYNYTGVYYLELPAGSPPTEILDHNNNLHVVDAHEGDIIMFPSILIHRSPPVEQSIRKTIISFNVEFELEPEEEQVY